MPKPPEPPEPDIHRAARLGDIAALEQLVAAGADINAPTDLEVDNGPHMRRLTPLMVAARSIDGAGVETLRWLLDHGADLRAESEGGNSAAWYAAGKGARWDFHPWRLCPDHAERLRFLLDQGLDPKETNFIGRSLLTEACDSGDPSAVRLLLERGAPHTPLFNPARAEAVHKQMLQSMRDALGQDSPPDGVGGPAEGPSSYEIPLFCAAASGNADCVRLLLAAGASVNQRDDSGCTPLFQAGSPEVATALIKAGVDLGAVNKYGRDALDEVLEGGCGAGVCGPERFEVAAVLVKAGMPTCDLPKWPHSRLATAAFGRNAEAVSYLLGLGVSVVPPSGAPTALHCVCWQGEYDSPEESAACERIVRELVKAGTPVGSLNEQGRTPLHEAAAGDWGNQTAVRTLLELGAQPDPVDPSGSTPLMLAADRGETECVRLLLGAGADPTKEDGDGWCAVDHARGHHRTWVTLNESEAPVDMPTMEPGAMARQWKDALRGAGECLELLLAAARARGWKDRPAPEKPDSCGGAA